MIIINGILERLTYRNPENHYTIGKLRMANLADPITIVGYIAGVAEGETLKLGGKWGSHPKYGDQFKIETFEVVLPATMAGIRKYLSSGIITGLGPGMADKIVAHFGEQTLDIIENEPGRLTEINGIGKAKQERIEKAWNKHHSVRRVMKFLQDFNISVFHATLILKNYGADALHILKNDPYAIAADIPKFGFQIADSIALGSGVEKDDPRRVQAYILNFLLTCEDDGHVYAFKEEVIDQCAAILKISPDHVILALQSLDEYGSIILESDDSDQTRVYLKKLYRAEKGIADRIKAFLSMPAPDFNINMDQITELVLSNLAVKLSEEQLEVVCQVLAQRIVVITGGPGTGKTTLIRALCTVFNKLNRRIVLSAPTGRAARRLSEVTGKKAFTLHKLLGYDPESGSFEKNFVNPLELDVFVIDEASMVDTLLMFYLIQAAPIQSMIILVGDTFQLPSVGPGNILSDIISSEVVKTFFLTKIFRQAKQSPIIMNAHRIRNGEMPDLKPKPSEELSEFYFIENHSPKKVAETIISLCSSRIQNAFPHIDEIQVLTPMHRGETGTINLNQRLQEVLNPATGGMDSGGMTFRPGDKVMHLKNNYEKDVFNGDIGTVCDVSKSTGKLSVDYDGRKVEYDIMELDELTLAYTISVHKSQGSEYSAVIIALTLNHFPLLQRNLLYTAMTRGKSLVIIVGSKKALETALNNNKTQHRRSGLKEKLAAPM